jgi:hypothetical protein
LEDNWPHFADAILLRLFRGLAFIPEPPFSNFQISINSTALSARLNLVQHLKNPVRASRQNLPERRMPQINSSEQRRKQ